MTVNHDVTGSSPVGGATRERPQQRAFFLVIIHMTDVRYLSLFTNLNRFERVQDGCFFICNRKVLLFLVFMSCQCHQNILTIEIKNDTINMYKCFLIQKL